MSLRDRSDDLTSSMIKRIGGIGVAGLLGQLVVLAAAPVLTRLYDPTAFGKFGLFVSIGAILGTLPTLGLSEAVIVPSRKQTALALVVAGAISTFFLGIALAVVAGVAISQNLWGLGVLPLPVVALLAVHFWGIGLITIAQGWLVRAQDWKMLALSLAAQPTMRSTTQVLLGLFGLGFWGLAIGEVLARCAMFCTLLRLRSATLRETLSVPREEVVAAVRAYRHFIYSRTPSSLLNNIGTMAAIPLVAARYGVEAAGLFTLMDTMLNIAIAAAIKAAGDVFLGYYARLHRDQPRKAFRLLGATFLALLAMGVAIAVVLYWAAAPLFAILFGEHWRGSGELAAAFGPAFASRFAVAPISWALIAANRPEIKLIFDVLLAGLTIFILATAAGTLVEVVGLLAWSLVPLYVLFLGMIVYGAARPRAEA